MTSKTRRINATLLIASISTGRAFLGLLGDSEAAFDEAFVALFEVLDATWVTTPGVDYMQFNAGAWRSRGEREGEAARGRRLCARLNACCRGGGFMWQEQRRRSSVGRGHADVARGVRCAVGVRHGGRALGSTRSPAGCVRRPPGAVLKAALLKFEKALLANARTHGGRGGGVAGLRGNLALAPGWASAS
jgi:hypothetical protein